MLGAVTLIDRISQALSTGPSTVVIEPPGTGRGYWAGGPSVVFDDGDLSPRLPAAAPGRPGPRVRQCRRPVHRWHPFRDGGHRVGELIPVRIAGTAGADPPAGRRLAAVRQLLDAELQALVGGGHRHPSRRFRRRADERATDRGAARRPAVRLEGRGGRPGRARAWRMWACEHLLDQGDDEADRMRSVYLTSDDGLTWSRERTALGPTPDTWDAVAPGSPAPGNPTANGSPAMTAGRPPRRTGSNAPGSRSAPGRMISSPWPARSSGTAEPCGTSASPGSPTGCGCTSRPSGRTAPTTCGRHSCRSRD